MIYINFYNQSNSGLKSNEISCVSEDSEKTIWVGTASASAYYFSDNNLTSINVDHKNKRSIEGYTFGFYHDNQGITWIGTDGDGVAKCDKLKAKFNNILEFDKKVFPHDKGELVFALSGTGPNIYIGIKDRSLIEYNEDTKQFSERINLNPLFNRHNPRQIIVDHDTVWLGYEMGVKLFSNKKKKYFDQALINEANYVYSIAITKNNDVWVGGNEGLKLFRKGDLSRIPINSKNPLFEISNDFIRVLHRDKLDNIWVGTTGNGLFHYNTFQKKLMKIDNVQGFDCSDIRCFKEINQNMFIGTDCGFYILNKDFEVIKNITTKDGLPNDVIYSIEKSLNSGIWIGSNAGLTFVSEDFKKIKNYTVDDGLPSNEFNTGSSFISESGLFYFGTMKGLVVFNEKEIFQNSFQPSLKISDIWIDNKLLGNNDWKQDSTISVEYNQRFIKIILAVSNYSDSKNNYCEYKIDGFNDWTRVPENNELLFTGLSSGKYNLSIKGFNNDDVPTLNTINLILDIETPLWKQGWLYFLFATCIILISYLLLKREWKNRERELKYKSEIEEIRNVALRSQMNPHFIFNCLSAIEYLMISDSSEKAQQYLNKFSRLVRNTLDFTTNELVSLKDEISHLNLYVLLENLRFENRINYECIVAPDINLGVIEFPPLVLQPLVENSIKHGFSENIKLPKVVLTINKTDKYLEISIVDNGIGFQNSKSANSDKNKKSYGLEVTRQRLQMYSKKLNKNTDFQISDLSDKGKRGTEILIKIEL